MHPELVSIDMLNKHAIEACHQREFQSARNTFVYMLLQLKKIQTSLDNEGSCDGSTNEQDMNQESIVKSFACTSFSTRNSNQNLDALCGNISGQQQINQVSSTTTSTYYVRLDKWAHDEYFSGAFMLPEPIEGEQQYCKDLYVRLYTSVTLYNFGFMNHLLGEDIGSITSHQIALRFYLMSSAVLPEVDSSNVYLSGLILRLGAAIQCNIIYIQRTTFFDNNGSEELIQKLRIILGIWRSIEVSYCEDINFFMRQLFLIQRITPLDLAPAA